jgi:phosphoglucosamine mutase
MVDDNHTTGDGIRTALFVIQAFIESGNTSMAQFASGVIKTPQVIASAYVGDRKFIKKEEFELLEKQLLTDKTGLIRVNLRYSGTEPLFRAMLESDHQLTEQDLVTIAIRLCRQVQEKSDVKGKIEILNCTRGGVEVVENN